jgi:hypothetical protein
LDIRLARQVNALATVIAATAECIKTGWRPPYA